MTPVQVYLGYDPRQPVAAQVAAHSLWQHATCPVSITRLVLKTLPMTRRGLTDFTYARFLAPWLSDFAGVSIFLDSDVLVRGDVAELLAYPLSEPDTPVFVVQGPKKFEWASVMVFNNARCLRLTPEFLDDRTQNPLTMAWADAVGRLAPTWNHLVGYDAPNPDAKLVHFTQGIPIWPETKTCEFHEEWHAAARQSMSSVSFATLMGHSVHVAAMQKVGA